MSLVLRADGGRTIGAGHLMRCLSLAGAAAELTDVMLATTCRSGPLLEHVERAAIPYTVLDEELSVDRDADRVASLAGNGGSAVIDGYHFSQSYVQAVRARGVRTLVIDDEPRLASYESDWLLDQNLGALRQSYTMAGFTRPLLGPRFTLTRTHAVSEPAGGVAGHAVRLLVTMGASDPPNATTAVLRALALARDRFEITVVIGGANPHADSVRAAASALPRVRVVQNASDMAALMADADLAISAVGITIWELARLGVPTLLLTAADLHHSVAATAHSYGAHRWIGALPTVSDEAIVGAAIELAEDAGARAAMQQLGRSLIDGGGAKRVAHALVAGDTSWFTRRAATTDTEAAWEMRDARNSQAPLTFAEHDRWYTAALATASPAMWLIECQGSPAAFVHYRREHGVTMATLTAAGSNLATPAAQLLRDTSENAAALAGGTPLRAMAPEHDTSAADALLTSGFRRHSGAVLDGREYGVFIR